MNRQAWIELNGFNTWKDFQLKMFERGVDPPLAKVNRSDLPRTHGTLDLSRGPRDEIYYEDRYLHYGFRRVIPSQQAREGLKFQIEQAFSRFTNGILVDSMDEYYEYHDVQVSEMHFSDMKNNLFVFQVDFIAYPYKRYIYSEGVGFDFWDSFDFDLGLVQDVSFKLPDITEQLGFLAIPIGDMVTLGGWSQYRAGGSRGLFSNFETERWYEVVDVRYTDDTDHSKLIYSGVQYKLDDGSWVREQDIVQARPLRLNVILENTGTKSAIPEIIQVPDPRNLGGITIELNGEFYNFRNVGSSIDFNDKLALEIGKNNLKIYGQGTTTSFRWYREVI